MNRLLLSALALTACAPAPEAAPPPAVCNAAAAAGLVGRRFSAALRTEAEHRAGGRLSRVIRAGQAVTMDYREDRLNVKLDARDIVTGFSCG